MLKWAAGPKTYPISRAFTSPAVAGAAGAAIGTAIAPGVGTVIGGGAAYGLARLVRWVRARGLASRALRGGLTTGGEADLIKEIVKAKLTKGASFKDVLARSTAGGLHKARYPFSELLTSRTVHGAKGIAGSAMDLAAGGGLAPEGIAGIAALSGGAEVGAEHIRRVITSRGFRGRLARGGEGLYPMELKVVEMIKGQKRKETLQAVKNVAKRVAVAGGIGAAAVGGGMAAHKALKADVATS
jgi:hypothetical protein